VATHYLGAEILLGLKNMEKDAIMGRMSLARYISEDRAIMLLEYTIMGLALMLFLSFPLKVAPALAYGLLPPLFFLAKGIDSGAVTREALLNFAKTYDGQGVARKYQWTDTGELTTTLIWIYKVQ